MNSPKTSLIRRSAPYALNAAKLIIADRGMFIADFFLATTMPFLIQFLIWSYLYATNRAPENLGMSLKQTLFYYAFAIAFGRLNNGYDIVSHLSSSVHGGTLEPHLLRPLAYPLQRLADFLGGGFIYTIPILAILCCYLIDPPVTAAAAFWPGWILLLLLSQILCFTIAWSIAMVSFWLIRTDFALSLLTTGAAFFGGELLPAQLWPAWLRPIMSYNPMRFMISAPADAIVSMDLHFLAVAIGWTSLYVILFSMIAAMLWRKGLASYAGAGG